MKTYLLSIKDQLRNWNMSLDAKSILCSKSWLVFNEEGQKEVFIFQKGGTLIISVDGRATKAQWQYIAINGSVLITNADGSSFMMNPAIYDEKVFTLQLDGTNEYAFLIDQQEVKRLCIENMERLNLYITDNAEYCRQLQAEAEAKEKLDAERHRQQQVEAEEKEKRLREAREKWEAEIEDMLSVWKDTDTDIRKLCEKDNKMKKWLIGFSIIAVISLCLTIINKMFIIIFILLVIPTIVIGLFKCSNDIDYRIGKKRSELKAAHPFTPPANN